MVCQISLFPSRTYFLGGRCLTSLIVILGRTTVAKFMQASENQLQHLIGEYPPSPQPTVASKGH